MINRQDCILLLTEMQENGIDVKQQFNDLFISSKMPEVIKYINQYKELDLVKFYEKIRKSYNNKKSDLYINIMKEITEPNEVLTTLAALQLQILIFLKNCENKDLFLRSSRSEEISSVLKNYFVNYDITNCIKLLTLIKADIKVSLWCNGKE